MRVVILAGGMGSRLQEQISVRPKPMVEIGHRPMLWHITKIYAAEGFWEFINVSIDLRDGSHEMCGRCAEERRRSAAVRSHVWTRSCHDDYSLAAPEGQTSCHELVTTGVLVKLLKAHTLPCSS